ncbi:hypothetical protein KO506_13375 [Polaribacter vadi]|uniref:hypothetical protein n=1 Tax=Polaribacter TaxID=52959 RepID=UPI001C080AC5|nr:MULTISPECIES: hypothetical protein [Polaribacter]MBU3012399.1 hypothetical protein [Polaribacter vadi]MDO6742216.1 hypothetical protein [Polaribacter sp. 1_MG-2023]
MKIERNNDIENKFEIGDIVTLNSHPLFVNNFKKISEFPGLVPPLMIVKEVFFERKENKKVFSSDIENAQIADLIKYNCVYFNANKSEFCEKVIYESFLRTYKELKYYRVKDKEGNDIKIPKEKQLIPEVLNYNVLTDYNYGEVIQFKTKKLEHRKSYENSFEKLPGISYQTPNFIVSGLKKQTQEDLFYNNGGKKKIVPSKLLKVTWFNHFQNKMCEHFLPFCFFVKELKI